MIHQIAISVACGDCSDLDLVGNIDPQQPHQLSAAAIGDERDPREAQQARRVGGSQRRAIEFLLDEIKIMVGGAPVTQEFADDMGADGYGKDAMACVALAKQLMGVEAR